MLVHRFILKIFFCKSLQIMNLSKYPKWMPQDTTKHTYSTWKCGKVCCIYTRVTQFSKSFRLFKFCHIAEDTSSVKIRPNGSHLLPLSFNQDIHHLAEESSHFSYLSICVANISYCNFKYIHPRALQVFFFVFFFVQKRKKGVSRNAVQIV